jgi:hypothetical protein
MATKNRTAGAVQQLREQVIQLCETGLSFSRVAAELGISKSYAVKLGQPTGTPAVAVRVDRLNLSVRQRRFDRGLIQGRSYRQAALEAAPTPTTPSGADGWANRTLQDPQFANEFQRLLDQAGLGEEQLAQAHAEALGATRVVNTVIKNGKITAVLEHPDCPTRLRAGQLGWDLHGRRRPGQEEAEHTPIFIKWTLEIDLKVSRLLGRPVMTPDGPVGAAERDTRDPEKSAERVTTGQARHNTSPEDESNSGFGTAAESREDQNKPTERWEF